MKKHSSFFRYLFVSLWLGLTVSLAIWWTYFNTQLISKIVVLSGLDLAELERQKVMLLWEGGFWLVLLVFGALTIVYFMRAEQVQRQGLQKFVAAFSHDLKTSLASLRLQAESLQEDLNSDPNFSDNRLMGRLLADTVRLELQLENSLFLARGQRNNFLLEDVSLSRIIDPLKSHWPDLDLSIVSECSIRTDVRAAESIFKNVIHNAVIHGGAKSVYLDAKHCGDSHVTVDISSDGIPFSGQFDQLGQMFYRHNPSSGSGVGLHIVKLNISNLGGGVDFLNSSSGQFVVRLKFEGRLL